MSEWRVVEVEWLDSMSEGRWFPKADAVREATREAMLHRSVGYLIHETEDMLLLAGSRGEDGGNVCDTMQIPRVAVIAVRSVSATETAKRATPRKALPVTRGIAYVHKSELPRLEWEDGWAEDTWGELPAKLTTRCQACCLHANHVQRCLLPVGHPGPHLGRA